MINLLDVLPHCDAADDQESRTAFYRTRVPWLAPMAYLHVVFKPTEAGVLRETCAKLQVPSDFADFLSGQNGAILFSGALSIFGIHSQGQLLNREDVSSRSAFDIETENESWTPTDPKRHFVVGGYGFDGSRVCIDRDSSQIALFDRVNQQLSRTARCCWPSLNDWISSEILRLSTLFNSQGKRLVDERQTVPNMRSPA